MNYEQMYKGALERAKTGKPIDEIFPELKESEDEKIRKDLINYFNENRNELGTYHHMNINNIIAWLEKQGEQVTTLPKWRYKKDISLLLKDSLILNKYGCVAKSPSGALVSDVWVIDYDELAKLPKEEFEKQDEQKPTDKVEPKFHAGDFITDGKRIFQIEETIWERNNRNDGSTYCESLIVNLRDGITYVNNTDLKEYHLWTIQDAKDGDVLYECNEKKPFIFKELKTKNIGDIASYCDIFNDIFNPNEDDWTTLDIVPATKEQCDLLFSKMKDAGYKWDAESLKLQKIKQIPTELKDFDSINYNDEMANLCDGSMSITNKDIARHFYELGLKFSSKEQSSNNTSIPNGVYLVCKDGSYSSFCNIALTHPHAFDKIGIAHDGHYFAVPLNWNLGKHKLLNNDKCLKFEHCQSETEAIIDWDFVKHTKHIQELGTPVPLKDGQYLLTAPVFLTMYKYRDALNSALNYANAEQIDFGDCFWFAQSYNEICAWFFNGYFSNLSFNYVDYEYQCVAVSLWKP